ncbi:MAG TPA: hypothetical protein VMR62_34225 [Bryobacteraceae bacterium]|nr:hypothetical protein [Bryobacteraceae bacterium]
MIFQQLTDPLQRGLFWLNLAPPEAPLSRNRKDSPPFVKYFLMNYFEHFEAPLSFIEKNFQVIEIVWHS